MDLMFYRVSPIEQWIADQYQTNGILHATDIDIEKIAQIFGGSILSTRNQSHLRWENQHHHFVIFLNEHLDEQQKRQQFFELLSKPLIYRFQVKGARPIHDSDEKQRTPVSWYTGLPLYMLQSYQSLTTVQWMHQIEKDFQLPPSFIKARRSQIHRRVVQEKMDKNPFLFMGPCLVAL